MLTYDQYRPKAQTMDMLCFSGTGLISTGIKIATGSWWSHIGTTIRASEWDFLLSWESTLMCPVADVQSGFVKRGVMLVPLQARIQTYDGVMGVRRILKPLTIEQLVILRNFRHRVKNRPYETNYIELIKSHYDGPFGKNTHDLSSIFCSELFAEACLLMELIKSKQPSNEFTQADLIEKYKDIWGPIEKFKMVA